MASIRNRNGKWQARITRKGQQAVAKSFSNKQDAEKWARQLESEMDKGCYTNLVLAERTLFSKSSDENLSTVDPSSSFAREVGASARGTRGLPTSTPVGSATGCAAAAGDTAPGFWGEIIFLIMRSSRAA